MSRLLVNRLLLRGLYLFIYDGIYYILSLACSGRGLNNDQPVLSDDEREDLFHLFVLSRTTMKTPTAFVRPYLLLILLFGGYGLLVAAGCGSKDTEPGTEQG